MSFHRSGWLAAALLSVSLGQAAEPVPALDKPIPKGAKVFLAPVEGGFENYLAAGIMSKQVPVTVVSDRAKADFEITAIAESEKASWAKMLFANSTSSREQAGIKVTDLKSGEVVFAYAVHKGNSARGKQSAAEACAKHLKQKVEGVK